MAIQKEIPEGWDLYDRIAAIPGETIIKAAGNMAWPMGPRTERLAGEVEAIAKEAGLTFERVAGISGATILGNGKVALILDLDQLFGLSERSTAPHPNGRIGREPSGPTVLETEAASADSERSVQ